MADSVSLDDVVKKVPKALMDGARVGLRRKMLVESRARLMEFGHDPRIEFSRNRGFDTGTIKLSVGHQHVVILVDLASMTAIFTVETTGPKPSTVSQPVYDVDERDTVSWMCKQLEELEDKFFDRVDAELEGAELEGAELEGAERGSGESGDRA